MRYAPEVYSSVTVDFVICVEDWGSKFCAIVNPKPQSRENSMASDLSRLPTRFTVRFENLPGEFGFPCKNSGPQTLHLLVRDQPAFVKEICNPIVLHVVRFGLRANIGKNFERD